MAMWLRNNWLPGVLIAIGSLAVSVRSAELANKVAAAPVATAPAAKTVLEQAVKVVVPQRLGIEAGGRRFQVPYMFNVPLDRPNPRIDRAIIVIHGLDRDADVNFENVMRAARQTATSLDRTAIVAPQFLNTDDAAALKTGDDIAIWRGGDWAQGDDNQVKDGAGNSAKISSFLVVDRLMERLADKSVFPKLRTIVVAGHSAGGQFVNRYAAGNQLEEKLNQERGIRVRYIVANPSSYLYFNEERPVLDSPGQFAKPTDEQIKACGGYNDYRYGLNKLNPYMQAVGAEKIRKQYAQREVFYLLGTEDKDPNHPALSKSCPAMMEGRHRLERGQNYYSYLRHYFGPEIAKHHRLQLVQGVAHSSRGMFTSPVGVRCLLDAPIQKSKAK